MRTSMLVLAMLLAVAAAALDALLVVAAVPLASELLSGDASSIFNFEELQLSNPIFLAALAVVGKNILQIASTYLISRAGFSVITEGTVRAFSSTLNRSTMSGQNAGEQQASVITEPVQLVLNVVNPLMSLSANLIAVIILLFTVTLVISPQLYPLIGVFLLLFLVYTFYSRSILRMKGAARRMAEAERTGFARSGLKANGETGYSSWGTRAIERFLRRPTETVERAIAVKWYFTETYKNVLELTVVVSAVLFFFLFDWRDNAALLSQLAGLAVAAARIAPAVNRSMVNFQTLQFGMPSLHSLAAVWDTKNRGDVYGQYEAIWSDVTKSFKIQPRSRGEAIARVPLESGLVVITGNSGIGKTSLLLQMAECVRDRKLGYLAFVSQDVLVLPASLHDNIYVAPERNGHSTMTAQTISRLADYHDSVLSQSRVSADDGSLVDAATLSGGQARRLALMRALASNPDVLIADEPTTGLHNEMLGVLIDILKDYAAHHVVIVSSHDARLIAAATAAIEL